MGHAFTTYGTSHRRRCTTALLIPSAGLPAVLTPDAVRIAGSINTKYGDAPPIMPYTQ